MPRKKLFTSPSFLQRSDLVVVQNRCFMIFTLLHAWPWSWHNHVLDADQTDYPPQRHRQDRIRTEAYLSPGKNQPGTFLLGGFCSEEGGENQNLVRRGFSMAFRGTHQNDAPSPWKELSAGGPAILPGPMRNLFILHGLSRLNSMTWPSP